MFVIERGMRADMSDKFSRTAQGALVIRSVAAELTAMCDGRKRYVNCIWTSVFPPEAPYLFVVTDEPVMDYVLANDNRMHAILDESVDEADIDTYEGSVYGALYAKTLQAAHDKMDEKGVPWPENAEDDWDD